ncbi:MAG: hypothetical protein EXS13_12430 [Planctomycetes bacterium]|nr:hypothetical protein [Planctomycetota bacterium]
MNGRRFGREALLFLLAIALTAAATWPLVLHLGPIDRLADKTLDDHVYWWNFWWTHEALVVRGVDPFFCPDIFVPHGASLVASPFAFPLGVLSIPLQEWLGTLSGVVVAVKLFGFLLMALGVWSMSLFTRALGVPLLASLFAGMLFSFTPFRMVQLGRIHYLAGALAPLFLHAALQAARGRRRWWYVLAGTWLALTAAIDASSLPELFFATGALLWFEWRQGAPFRRTAVRLVAAGLVGVALLSPLLVRFLVESRSNRGLDVASRLTYEDDPSVVQRILSPDLDGLLWFTAPALHEATLMAAGEADKPWGSRSAARLSADIYEPFRPPGSTAVRAAGAAVGAAVVVAVLLALVAAWRVPGSFAFGALALLGFVLALGPQRTMFGAPVDMPYGWLARVVPGMAAGRYPCAHLRLFELGLTVAAALGACRFGRWRYVMSAVAAVAFLAAAASRPFAFTPFVVDDAHQRMLDDPTPGAVLEIPARSEIMLRRMAFGQVVHHRPLMAGPLTRVPPESFGFFDDEPFVCRCMRPLDPALAKQGQLEAEYAENREVLARYGVRYVVLRRSLFEHNRTATLQLIEYLRGNGFTVLPTADGGALVRVATP